MRWSPGHSWGKFGCPCLLACLVTATLIAAPSALGHSHPVELTTYGYGNSRLGSSPGPIGISSAQARGLHVAWRANLSGAIDGQPIIVNGVRFRHRRRNLVLVGTGHGEVAAVDVGNGKIMWTRHVGARRLNPGCLSSPDARFGVTGTLVADRTTNLVYAVDVNGRAWAFSLTTGKGVKGWPVRAFSGWPQFDWGGLALSDGRLYIPTASECGNGRYYGSLRAVDLRTHRVRSWFSTRGTGAYGGGVWGWGGESIEAGTGDVFVGTGNGIGGPNEHFAWAEHVLRFSPNLHILQSNYPLRPPFAEADRDFGTAPLLIHRAGCPEQLITFDKDGWLYRYAADHLNAGPRQGVHVASTTNSSIPLYGMAAYDTRSHRLVLTSPTAAPHGRRKGIQSYILNRHCRLVYSWQHGFDNPSAGSAPTIAQGVLYLGSGRNGILRAYRLSNGHELWHRVLRSTIFAAPAAADGTVFAGDWGGHLWAFRR